MGFSKKCSLSANPKHFTNEEQQSLKLSQDIIIPYMRKEKERLGLHISHPGLLIMNAFTGQKTTTVRILLPSRDIFFSKVLVNMTNLYQPPILTVNGSAKAFIKRMFTKCFATQISEALECTKTQEDIDITLNLSTLKVLKTKRIIELYDKMTSESNQNGIKMESSKLPPLDTFDELDSL